MRKNIAGSKPAINTCLTSCLLILALVVPLTAQRGAPASGSYSSGTQTAGRAASKGPSAPSTPVQSIARPRPEIKTDTRPLKFTSKAELVLVPTVVTRNGKPVTGLNQDDFTVYENGAVQRIASFEEVKADTTRVQHYTTAPGEFTNQLQGAERPKAVTIILLDLINTPFTDQSHARDELLGYLRDSVDGSQMVTVIAMTGGGLRVIHDFTSDPQQLVAALKTVRPHFDQTQDSKILPAATTMDINGPVSTIQAEIENVLRPTSDQVRNRQIAAEATLEGVQYIAQAYGGIPGRKSLIWITGGFPLAIDTETGLTGTVPLGLYQHTVELLAHANMALYPVDARGLWAMLPTRDRDANAAMKTTNTDIIGGMQFFAEATGGRAFVNRNDLGNGVKEAAQEGSQYYMLGYYLDRNNTKPGWRKLKVSVRQDGVNVRSRRGFYLSRTTMDPNSTREMDIYLAQRSPLNYTELPVNVILKPEQGTGKPRKVTFDVILPPKTATIDDQDDNRVNLDFSAVARSANGEPKASAWKTLDMKLKPEAIKQITESGITYRGTLELPPGQYAVRVIVRDNISGRMGSVLGSVTAD